VLQIDEFDDAFMALANGIANEGEMHRRGIQTTRARGTAMFQPGS